MDVPSASPPERVLLTPRQQQIVRLVHDQGFVTIEALARQFDVSTQTIRREIIRLNEAQVVQRFHGGAGRRENTIRLGYAQKLTISADAKERIGQAVANLIADGSSVFLDVGTTVEAVARALRAKGHLRVVTCSLAAAAILAGREQIDTFVTGGSVGGPDGSLVGDTTLTNIGRFKVDCGVFGCSGFEDDGTVMDFDVQKVAVKQAMLENCREALVAADATKFNRSAIVRIAPLSSFSTIVTDSTPPDRLRSVAGASGTRVIVAP